MSVLCIQHWFPFLILGTWPLLPGDGSSEACIMMNQTMLHVAFQSILVSVHFACSCCNTLPVLSSPSCSQTGFVACIHNTFVLFIKHTHAEWWRAAVPQYCLSDAHHGWWHMDCTKHQPRYARCWLCECPRLQSLSRGRQTSCTVLLHASATCLGWRLNRLSARMKCPQWVPSHACHIL